MKKHIHNERGLTLIELLATIVIGSIVIGLATSVFVSASKQNQTTYEHNALRQEANIIITKLRQIHQEQDLQDTPNSYTLCYESNEKMYLDTTLTNSLGKDGYKFKNVEFINAIDTADTYRSIDSQNECITNVDIYSPLLVKFTLVNQQGQEFDMNTAIARIKPLDEVMKEWEENEEEPVPGAPPTNDGEVEFEPIVNDDFTSYVELGNGDLNSCKYENTDKNYKVTGTLEYPSNNGNSCNAIYLPKSLYIKKLEITSGTLNITENFYNDGDSELSGNSTLNVLMDAKFAGDIEVKSGSSIVVGNRLQAAKTTLETNADIYVGDSAKFTSDLKLENNSELYVENNFFVQKLTLENGARIIVGNEAVFYNRSITLNGGSSICVEGKASFINITRPANVVNANSCENPAQNKITIVNKP